MIIGMLLSLLAVSIFVISDPVKRELAYAYITDGYINCMPGIDDSKRGQVRTQIVEGEYDHHKDNVKKEIDVCGIAKSLGMKIAY